MRFPNPILTHTPAHILFTQSKLPTINAVSYIQQCKPSPPHNVPCAAVPLPTTATNATPADTARVPAKRPTGPSTGFSAPPSLTSKHHLRPHPSGEYSSPQMRKPHSSSGSNVNGQPTKMTIYHTRRSISTNSSAMTPPSVFGSSATTHVPEPERTCSQFMSARPAPPMDRLSTVAWSRPHKAGM